jgi:hypothetical protein
VGTSQNRQARVQWSPKIIKVNVPFPQHSPILGQEADSHTVCSWYFRTKERRRKKASPEGKDVFNQAGSRLRESGEIRGFFNTIFPNRAGE